MRSLTFVVGTGRSGSTALSRVLSTHPDVLSLNELFASVSHPLAASGEVLTGAEFWGLLSAPNPVFDAMTRSGVPLPEFLYTRRPGRYAADTTGIPALSLMVLPHLADDPDALLDALATEVTGWPARPVPAQWRALFDALAARTGGAHAAVERSGYSTGAIPWLRRGFPEARFVHLVRDGPDCALSMSRHPGYRMITQMREITERCGVATPAELTPQQVAGLPPHLAGLLEDPFDPALVLRRRLPVTRFGALWSELVVEAEEHLAAVPEEDRTTLGYEGLLDAPREELARLARFVGVDPLPGWLTVGAALLDGTGRRGSSLALPPSELRALRESCAAGTRAVGGVDGVRRPG
ncbi:sulfotransferase [Streptomyces sp. AJS327]|uniref:sulfotransferase family protein n=1 Tax=Streptomyces sp. AJS327 TaxID=2545265 RepID=UPI0015DED007|nr:sulfotransferase [Streptomyces sp. AJS327]MBA0050609.1 sulfotransferase [Streptomyces sp. AJS327]